MDVSRLTNGDSEGKWYAIPKTEVQVRMKIVKPKRVDQIREECMVNRFTGTRAERVLDETGFGQKMLDEMVVDWKGMEKDGQPFACTTENKLWLDGEWPAFRNLWNAVLQGGQTAETLRVEEEIKN